MVVFVKEITVDAPTRDGSLYVSPEISGYSRCPEIERSPERVKAFFQDPKVQYAA